MLRENPTIELPPGVLDRNAEENLLSPMAMEVPYYAKMVSSDNYESCSAALGTCRFRY
jgi:hypothetical protein